MKASDISDERIIQIIEAHDSSCTPLSTFERELSEFPDKVILAKLRQMVNKGRLDADCTCGCQGPYRLLTEQRKTA